MSVKTDAEVWLNNIERLHECGDDTEQFGAAAQLLRDCLAEIAKLQDEVISLRAANPYQFKAEQKR